MINLNSEDGLMRGITKYGTIVNSAMSSIDAGIKWDKCGVLSRKEWLKKAGFSEFNSLSSRKWQDITKTTQEQLATIAADISC